MNHLVSWVHAQLLVQHLDGTLQMMSITRVVIMPNSHPHGWMDDGQIDHVETCGSSPAKLFPV